jgi:hypothetical protein
VVEYTFLLCVGKATVGEVIWAFVETGGLRIAIWSDNRPFPVPFFIII